MKITKFNIFRVTRKVVTWIFQSFNLRISGQMRHYIDLLLRFDHLNKSRGAIATVSYIKDCRTMLLRYLSGNPVRIKGVRSTKDGLPTILGDLIPMIRKGESPASLQILNTIMFCTRALRLGRNADISPIIDGPKRDPIDIGIYTDEFWRDIGYPRQARHNPKSLNFRRFHITTKSGPNGSLNAM